MDRQRILITGGTGTVGSALVAYLLERYPLLGEIVVCSNSEQEQHEMAGRIPPGKHPVRYMFVDVRDRERLMLACRGIDIVIHAAAMKHVPVCELNVIECAKTNVLGSQNVIDAAVANGVSRVVALSSDKAVAPCNAYGASKLFLERLFLCANSESHSTSFTVVRFANVFGSKGSVVPFFMQKRSAGFLPVTHPGMTRFSISMHEALAMVMFAVKWGVGGEVIVPKSPSYRILDVAEAVAPGVEVRIVGVRPGEKIHEIMLSASEAIHAVELDNYYVVLPDGDTWRSDKYCAELGALKAPDGFEYASGSNAEWLDVEAIRNMVAAGVD